MNDKKSRKSDLYKAKISVQNATRNEQNPKKEIMATVKKIFVEYGLDFDNNKYGLGRSTEVEYTDGTEMRTHDKIAIDSVTAKYVRIWVGKIVFVIDSDKPHFSFRQKNRWNLKIVCGKSGR